METRLSRFLFKYCLTPQSSTGVAPAELMFGRCLRSHLDHVHPSLDRKVRLSQERQKQGHDLHAGVRGFQVGDLVYVRNYGSGEAWLPGKVTEVQGSAIYAVLLDDGRSVRKHTDQLRARTGITEVRSALVVPGGWAVLEDDETDVPDVPSSAVTTDPGGVDQAVGDPPPPLPPDPVPDITAPVPSDEPDD